MKNYPAYRQVHDDLKKKIEEGHYPIHSLIPSEPELCHLYKVSRTTIRKAVELLEKEGILEIKQGRGTLVLDYTTTQRLNNVTSFTETMRSKGYDVYSENTFIEEVTPSKKVAGLLKISEDQTVVRIQRLQVADGHPIAIMTNYLLPETAPGILDDRDQLVSLYAYLEEKHGILITDTDDVIRAKGANFTESALLKVSIGHPLLVNNRVTYSNNDIIEVVEMIVDSSKYEFSVHLSGRLK